MQRLVYVSGVLVMEPAGTPEKEAGGTHENGEEDALFPEDGDAE